MKRTILLRTTIDLGACSFDHEEFWEQLARDLVEALNCGEVDNAVRNELLNHGPVEPGTDQTTGYTWSLEGFAFEIPGDSVQFEDD